jgi:hypothetical protein
MITDLGRILDNEMIESIRDSVKSNRHLWTHYSEYPNPPLFKLLPLYFFGSPIYPCAERKDLYLEYREKSEDYLKNTIKDLHELVMSELQDVYKFEPKRLANTSLPGFHIFNSAGGKLKQMSIPRYHIDSDLIARFPKVTVPIENFYSFVVVIETTSAGDTLDYIIDGEHKKHNYQLGHMYIWPANMYHKIGDVALANDDEYRITYQGHCIKLPDKLLFYW